MREEGCNILHPWNLSSSGYFHFSALKIVKMSRSTTKPTRWHVRPAKTQIRLGIHRVWSVLVVCFVGYSGPKLYSCGQWRLLVRLIWVFGGCTGHFVSFVFHYLKVRYTYSAEKCCGSNVIFSKHSYERIRTDFRSKNIQIFNKIWYPSILFKHHYVTLFSLRH